MLKLIPKRKITSAKQDRSLNNYVEHITQISDGGTTQAGWYFPYRLRIPVGTDKFG